MSLCCKLLQQIHNKYLIQGCCQRGASGVRSYHLKNVSSHFHVWDPGYCVHPILYLKKVPPLSYIWPPFCEFLATDLARPSENQSTAITSWCWQGLLYILYIYLFYDNLATGGSLTCAILSCHFELSKYITSKFQKKRNITNTQNEYTALLESFTTF